MKAKKTDSSKKVRNTGLNYNIRQGTIPSITSEQYVALIEEGEAFVDSETAEYLQSHGYAVGEE